MKKWVIGGALLGVAGVGAYFAFPAGKPVVPLPPPVPGPVAVATSPAAPTVLAKVVDVTDIDPLLDPPAIPVSEPTAPAGPALTAVGYDEPVPAPRPASDAPPIPPADDSEPAAAEIAPMPREVDRPRRQESKREPAVGWWRGKGPTESDWEAEFRPVPGPLFLDQGAVIALDARDEQDNDLMMFDSPKRSRVYEDFKELNTKGPLAPLVGLTDADLFRQRTEKTAPSAKSSCGELCARPTFWTPEPLTDPTATSVRRAYAVLNVPAQAPATRTEWYTRWYGDGMIPQQVSQAATVDHNPPRGYGQFF